MTNRIEALDSLRGLAALNVVCHHYLLIFPAIGWIKYSPLNAGTEAVLLFFVLSGYVLAMPVMSGIREGYGKYLLKRICRIYLPYAFATTLALIACASFAGAALEGLSPFVTEKWRLPLNGHIVIGHLLLIGHFNYDQINPVIWSLIHEMRISLVYPFLALAVARTPWWATLPVLMSVSLASLAAHKALYQGTWPHGDWAMTLYYVPVFLVGALLARYQGWLTMTFQRLPFGAKTGLLAAGLGLYFYSGIFKKAVQPFLCPLVPLACETRLLNDWFTCLGAAILIILTVASVRATRLLSISPLQFLGRISYSLYLLHMVVLLSALHIGYHQIPLAVLLPLTFLVTLAISMVAWRAIEAPSMLLGRYLATLLIVPPRVMVSTSATEKPIQ